MGHVFQEMVESIKSANLIDPAEEKVWGTEEAACRLILGFPSDAAARKDVEALFGEEFFPGTFAIGEIDDNPNLLCLKTSIGYDSWVRQEVRQEIAALKRSPHCVTDWKGDANIEDSVLEILEHNMPGGKRLRDVIALQEYTDIFRRVILSLAIGDPEREIDTFQKLNEIGRGIALPIVASLDGWSLQHLLKISLAAGLVGLNLKTAAAATSQIHKSGIIPIEPNLESNEQIEQVFERLRENAAKPMAIDYWEDYNARVLHAESPNLVVFTDDYIETIFDLKLIERQLDYNSTLRVWLIPRARRYGNDASYSDVIRLLKDPVFRSLKLQEESGRLRVCPNGPRLGTVNGLRISQDVADQLIRCDAVFVKGARAYEMLQGIGKHAYFGFAVCREISEAVTGVDAETGDLVFIRQRPFEPTFLRFRERGPRLHQFRSGRASSLCPVTARDCHEEYFLPDFYRDLCREGERAVRAGAIQIAPYIEDLDKDQRLGLTLIVRPYSDVARQLEAVNERLRTKATGHFLYEPSRFHFTIVSLITAHDDFSRSEIPLKTYEAVIREILAAYPPFDVEFIGIGATRNSLLAKGFPLGGILEAIREALRDRLHAAGLGRGVDERYRSRGAHITLARFMKDADLSTVVNLLDEKREAPFGRMTVRQAHLVVNDFYMSENKISILSEVPLGSR
jgi:2'-5' RNA ligase